MSKVITVLNTLEVQLRPLLGSCIIKISSSCIISGSHIISIIFWAREASLFPAIIITRFASQEVSYGACRQRLLEKWAFSIYVHTVYWSISKFTIHPALSKKSLCQKFGKDGFKIENSEAHGSTGKHLESLGSSVRPKLGFGIGNRNQDQVSVSVSGPEHFCLNLNSQDDTDI